MEIRVSRPAIDRLLAEAARASPKECCGILLGRDRHIEEAKPATNFAADALCRFEIDPQALVDAQRIARHGGPQVLGYYHSHPAGLAVPSATDRAQAAHDGAIWAIVGEADVTFWRDDEAGFAALSYIVDDG